jgi:hypothetical protein
MACAGFVFSPDAEACDKVMCAYCGVELGAWDATDDPVMAHNSASPGCAFWRRRRSLISLRAGSSEEVRYATRMSFLFVFLVTRCPQSV